ncbi:MAG: DUF4177 domain-containing protein [Thermodesulfobacteriota bacterium]
MQYKVVETSQVTEDSLEEILNRWTAEGWRYDGMQFVVKESARRPSMAFVLFVKSDAEDGK